MNKEHNWMMLDSKAASLNIYKCTKCQNKRFYSWSPGWPGEETFYTPEGDYTANHGRTEPPCDRHVQLSLPGLAL